MKVIIQLPCFNEEATLPQTLADLPRHIEGADSVEWLIVDDGSSDATAEVARVHGVDHIIRHKTNRGLAHAFRTALDASLRRGADIIVNTDADNQYHGGDVQALAAPILADRADIVVGDRQPGALPHFSPVKRLLQRLGSAVVRNLSGTAIPDAVSGFRAYSRGAALRLNILSSFSHTIDTLIQAGEKKMTVVSVPVQVNPVGRQSRLYRNTAHFVIRSVATMIRMYLMYGPIRLFFGIGAILSLVGMIPIFRFLVLYTVGSGEGHIQSLVIGAGFLVIGFVTFLVGLVADLVNFNRRLMEISLERVRRMELGERADGEESGPVTERRRGAEDIGSSASQAAQSDFQEY